MESSGSAKQPAKPKSKPASKGKPPSKSKPTANVESPAKAPKAVAKSAAKNGADPAKTDDRAPTADTVPGFGQLDRRWLLRGGLIGLILVVALVAWLATRGGDSGSSSPAAPAAPATRIVSVDELRQVAAKLGQPIYWAGPVAGTELELTELQAGEGVRIAYLPAGTPAGQGSAKVLTVGSYPLPDPTKSLEGFAKRPGAIIRHAADGSEVVVSERTPTSVYFASPENSVQVEVYDPSPQRALGLALSGKVQPAG